MNRYRRFSTYLREKFGCRVHRLCLNAGFSCPNRDGTLSTEGCIFCDNRAFSLTEATPGNLEKQILQGMVAMRKRFKAEKFLAYFQPYTNTYAPVSVLREKYDVIKKFPEIVGLIVGTRPDCLEEERVDLLASYTDRYEVWLEIGLPSVHDATLKLINRHHTIADFLQNFYLARKRPLKIAVHVILGLPGEGEKEIMETAKVCGELRLDGIKIHPLYLIRGTPLEKSAK
ncbi:MAG: TIGR01212 family radical SAM protein [Candidatus Omnitrophica bacterium]|nr:TIGR01212 family radical SAM protein [Candidatus Omnitrophota bacterium]